MEIKYKDIVLRDTRLSDIDDEIRWMNVDTDWMAADTPWESFEPVNEAETREQMIKMINGITPEAIRWRFEIEVDGKHIGFVCSYLLDENYEPLDYDNMSEDTKTVRALGTLICESSYWGRGFGTQALDAFINYYAAKGEKTFALETWSGNVRMLKSAAKLGFIECKRDVGVRNVDGTRYDALTLRMEHKTTHNSTGKETFTAQELW